MNILFPDQSPLPEGFAYLPDFISREEEAALLDMIGQITLHPFLFNGYTANRRVATFGVDWNFETKTLRTGAAIPPPFLPLVNQVAAALHLPPADFGELLVTEYPKNAVINWHRDAPPFDLIAGISLAADCIFRLRPWPHIPGKPSRTVDVPVARRSLYVMQGPARWEWQHSIRPVARPRLSITLRTLQGQF